MNNSEKKEVKKRSTYGVPKFYLDNLNSDRPEPIFLRFTFAPGKRISFYTGQRIEPANWSLENQRVKRNVTGGSDINSILESLAEAAAKAVRTAILTGSILTTEKLKELLNNVVGKNVSNSNFFDVYDRFVSTESSLKGWSYSTVQILATIRRQLQAFEVEQRKTQRSFKIELANIDDKFYQDLILFWQINYDLQNSTIKKYTHVLRWFFNWCQSKNISTGQYRSVKINLKGAENKKIIYLDLAEIGKIYRLDLPQEKKYLDRTKDIFIFQCLTGLRFSDLHNLKASDYLDGVIKVTAIKTGENIEINLNDTTAAIWQKYSEHQAATGKALPVPVNQVYNRFLKELAELAGLNEKITLVHYQGAQRIEQTYFKYELICSHTARRSFITNGLAVGIGSEVLKSWTGHKSEKSFQAYYEIVKQKKAADIQKFVI